MLMYAWLRACLPACLRGHTHSGVMHAACHGRLSPSVRVKEELAGLVDMACGLSCQLGAVSGVMINTA